MRVLRGIDVMVIVLYVRLLLKGVSTYTPKPIQSKPKPSPEQPRASPNQSRTSPEPTQDKPRSKAQADCKPKPSPKTHDFRGPFQGPY